MSPRGSQGVPFLPNRHYKGAKCSAVARSSSLRNCQPTACRDIASLVSCWHSRENNASRRRRCHCSFRTCWNVNFDTANRLKLLFFFVLSSDIGLISIVIMINFNLMQSICTYRELHRRTRRMWIQNSFKSFWSNITHVCDHTLFFVFHSHTAEMSEIHIREIS